MLVRGLLRVRASRTCCRWQGVLYCPGRSSSPGPACMRVSFSVETYYRQPRPQGGEHLSTDLHDDALSPSVEAPRCCNLLTP